MPQTLETSPVAVQRTAEAAKPLPSFEKNPLDLSDIRTRKAEHPIERRAQPFSNVKLIGQERRDAVQSVARASEVRTALKEEEQQGYMGLLRNEFLTPDRKGRCSAEGGNYREAFQDLLKRAGNPNQWRPEDMVKPEVIAAMDCYRAFTNLQTGRRLTTEQVHALQQLHSSQQRINEHSPRAQSPVDALVQQQQQATQVGEALQHIQPVKQNTEPSLAIPSNPDGTITWATPAEMGPQLTRSIWELHKASLALSDKDRASLRVPGSEQSVDDVLQGKGDKETAMTVVMNMLVLIAQAVARNPSVETLQTAA